MTFVAENQLLLLMAFFFGGCIGTAFIYRHPAGSRAWKLADLLWVVLGGFGAIAAVVAGVYTSDSSRLNRQIDVAYAATAAFDRDAARFRLRYCENGTGPATATLCDRAEFLSASTASNAELPLFISITEAAAPLKGLNFVLGPRETGLDLAKMRDEADAFDPGQFLAFTALDDVTQAAIETLRRTRPDVAADYQVLATSYEALIGQVARIKDEWEFLQSNAGILLLQIAALCMVAFAAPFRLGKSLADMRERLPAGRR
ncbi:hypothetical protein [Aestuariivita sp.]|jgi:hypothetical protein|uniref:hypothetical protein n=1 Tax=Aestuariivita sp. TaxID=1872407 RepID=UPI0021743319|nr:hypothetical protein [Aestuariivita sp.]MCE8008435.1 hypothetical protein [Aestuariivita sp.]